MDIVSVKVASLVFGNCLKFPIVIIFRVTHQLNICLSDVTCYWLHKLMLHSARFWISTNGIMYCGIVEREHPNSAILLRKQWQTSEHEIA